MKKTLLFLLLMACLSTLFAQKSNIDYVNPFIGTGGHGHTFPGVTAPFGMVQVSPDTRLDGWDGCSGYHYSDSIVYGFSHTHLSGTGVSDYGDILLMPTTGELRLNNGADGKPGYRSKFDKKKEKASCSTYITYLQDYNTDVILVANTRSAYHLYSYNESKNKNIILDLKHRDEVLSADFQQINDTTVQGYRISKSWAKKQPIYFYLRFSSPVKLKKIIKENGRKVVGGFTIKNEKTKNIQLNIAVSAVSIDNAKKNYQVEIGENISQKRIDALAETQWENLLNKIKIESPNENDKTNFYTALYHLYTAPNTIQDVDSQYLGMDLKPHKADDYAHYTVFSLWDTYRAAHPLHTILQPKRVDDFVKTFLNDYKHSGALPMWPLAANETWCMIGNHAIPVIVDNFLKKNKIDMNDLNLRKVSNFAKVERNQENEELLDAMIKTTQITHLGQTEYTQFGFIPAEMEHESVSKTLEYAYDDYCIALMAKAMNKDSIYRFFIRRAQNYKHVFNPENGFSQAKINNTWVTPFAPAEVNSHFTEGNSWHYSFSAPHDMMGFTQLHGGKTAVEAKLDALFSASSQTSGRDQSDLTGFIGQYVQGNEPSHHIAYLYNFVGKPHKTQALIHQIMTDFYKNQPDGLIGNEDCGQMSAWYIFSAMGFYPVNPCGGQYVIGTPHFPSVTIDLENGKSFTIKALNLSDKNFYIQSATLNGKPLTHSWIMHEDIMRGGELIFTMGSEPSNWATSEQDSPQSAIADNIISPLPFVKKGERSFMQNTTVELGCAERGSNIFYTLDGSEPNEKSNTYSQPIFLEKTTTVKFIEEKTFFQNKNLEKKVLPIVATFSKIPVERKIILKNKPAPQYSAGCENALIDYIKGNKNYHTGAWQGYEGIDCEAIIDLSQSKDFSKITVGVLQDQNAWIFAATEIQIFTSEDNINFKPFDVVKIDIDEHAEGAIVKDFSSKKTGKSRYVKVVVKNRGLCPTWHKGAAFNGKSWIFLDEITIE